ncbi:MAG: lamin tail domain-containing protein [Flavobacteriales bacterium]|nr:lamin tail domain-containing protein [Flavobacteriales bacterium]
MKQILMLVLLMVSIHMSAQVLITELHPVPAAGEPEWLELENTSPDDVDASGWLVCDARSCSQIPSIAIWNGRAHKAVVPAGGRLVVTRDAEALAECRRLPDGVLVAELPLPSLNNSTEIVTLRKPDSTLTDSVYYSMKKHVKGRSIERDAAYSAGRHVYNNSWLTCVAADSTTCGLLNSVIRLPHDRWIAAIVVADYAVEIHITNHGQSPLPPSLVQLTGAITAPDSMPADQHYTSLSVTVPALLDNETYKWDIPLADLDWPTVTGSIELTAILTDVDDRPENDTLTTSVILPPPPGTIMINEIMYDSWSGQADYVELANVGEAQADITGWKIQDAGGAEFTISVPATVTAGEYVVLASSEAVAGLIDGRQPLLCKPVMDLNKTGDRVILRSASGFLVDMVEYNALWHLPGLDVTTGVSLEKINPKLASNSASSWTSSGALRGGTPGYANSVITPLEFHGSVTALPSPFSSSRTSALHPTVISYRQPFRHALVSVTIRSTRGAEVRSLMNSVFSGSEGAVAWDGTSNSGLSVEPGPYLVVVECSDAASSAVSRSVTMVVVGE